MFFEYLLIKIKDTTNFVKNNLFSVLLSFVFIFGVIWTGNVISVVTSRDILDPLTIKIEGLDDESLSSVKVLSKLSRAGNTVNLAPVPGHLDQWNNPAKTFIQKVMVGFQDGHLESFTFVSVSLGDKKFVYSRDGFLNDWKKMDITGEDLYLYDSKGNSGYSIYEAPSEIKSNPLNIPIASSIFSSINLNGSEKLIKQPLFYAIQMSFLSLAILLIVGTILMNTKKNKEDGIVVPYRFFVVCGLSISLTVFLLFIFNILVLIFYKPDTASILIEASKVYLVSTLPAFLPEPVERVQFVFSIFLSPFFLLVSYLFTKKYIIKVEEKNISHLYYILSLALPLVLFAFIFIGLSVSNFLYIKTSFSFNGIGKYLYTLLFFPLGAYLMFFCNWKKYIKYIKYFTYIFSGILVALIFTINIFPFNSSTDFFHLNPIFYPMAQVMVGKSMLVNLTGLYGLFPVFLKPILQSVGFSILSFTTIMGFLLASSYIFLFLFLKKQVKNIPILLIGFSSIIFYFLEKGTESTPYFQYFPVRILFPSLVLFLVSYYVGNKKKILYYLIHFVAAISILWNLDSGVIIFLSWILVLCYGEFYIRNIKKLIINMSRHIFVGLLVLGMCVTSFGIYTYFNSGYLPDLSLILQYQKMFLAGYFMIPMPFPHVWIVAGLVLLVGLFMSIRGWWDREKNRDKNFVIFFLSVMGFGLFIYYEGRSHDLTFYSPLFAVIALLTIQTDVLYNSYIANRKSYGYGILFLVIFFFLFSSPINLIYNSGKYYSWIENRIVGLVSRPETVVTRNVDFIKKHTIAGEDIIILSQNFYDGIFYGESGTRSALDLPSSTDVFFKQELSYLINSLECNKNYKVFVYPYSNYYFYDNDVNQVIKNNYKVIDRSEDDMALLINNSFDEKKCDSLLLKNKNYE